MFTASEVRQYQDIFTRWYRKDSHAIPTRYSRNVVNHAITFGFLRRADNHRTVYIERGNSHLTGLDLPAEVLWSILRPTIEQHSGFSITGERVWRGLNISKDEIALMERALFILDAAGFINFQSAGRIWRIDIR